jgi:chloride channel protein, CIC family
MEEQREESDLHIEDALEPWLHPIFKGADTAAAILSAKAQPAAPVILIQCSDSRWYAARLDEIEKFAALQANADKNDSIESLLVNERTPTLFPDQPLDTALHHLSRWPLLPATNRSRRGVLEGVVTLEGILRRYQQL